MKIIWLGMVVNLILATVGAIAQETGWWSATLPKGEYQVRLASVESYSHHEYAVDRTFRVTEFTVGTTGRVIARFYHLEPLIPSVPVGQSIINSVQDKVQDGIERVTETTGVSEPLLDAVIKNYPTTTHAGMVEFRVANKDTIQQLFNSLKRAMRTGSGTFTEKNE